MQIVLESELTNNIMLYGTCLCLVFGYFCYGIVTRLIDRQTHLKKINQYARLVKDNEHLISAGASRTLGFVERTANQIYHLCINAENGIYNWFRQSTIMALIGSIAGPFFSLLEKWVSLPPKNQPDQAPAPNFCPREEMLFCPEKNQPDQAPAPNFCPREEMLFCPAMKPPVSCPMYYKRHFRSAKNGEPKCPKCPIIGESMEFIKSSPRFKHPSPCSNYCPKDISHDPTTNYGSSCSESDDQPFLCNNLCPQEQELNINSDPSENSRYQSPFSVETATMLNQKSPAKEDFYARYPLTTGPKPPFPESYDTLPPQSPAIGVVQQADERMAKTINDIMKTLREQLQEKFPSMNQVLLECLNKVMEQKEKPIEQKEESTENTSDFFDRLQKNLSTLMKGRDANTPITRSSPKPCQDEVPQNVDMTRTDPMVERIPNRTETSGYVSDCNSEYSSCS